MSEMTVGKEYRKEIAESVQSSENKNRKAISLKQTEVYNDRLYQYVIEELKRHFSAETVNEMPIVSFINFPKRIVKNISSVYKHEPSRIFINVSEDQEEKLALIYKDGMADWKFKKANEFYSLQDQTHLYVYPEDGKLCFRNLVAHQIDAIPNKKNPEKADAYILSSFDKEKYLSYQVSKTATGFSGKQSTGNTNGGSGLSGKTADSEDYKKTLNIHTYWDKNYNFIFNGNGDFLDPDTLEPYDRELSLEDILSPIQGTMPIIDISLNKDSEYFVRAGNSIIDFGVQYNAAFSDVWHISRMQGYSVGVLKGPEELMPETLRMGPNLLLRLKTSNAAGVIANGSDIDFKYASPSPDIPASLQLLETMLVNFISSRGIDPKEIATEGGKTYNSALERLIAMIDRFEASKDDFKLFRNAEDQVFEVVKAWINSGTDEIDLKYRMAALPEDATIDIKYAEPQMVMTEQEKLAYWSKRKDLGTASRVDALMDIERIDRESALIRAAEIDSEEMRQFHADDNQPE